MPKESNFHITPESGRYAISLTKEQLKWVKKMSIDFEVPIKKLLPIAVDSMINRYQKLNIEDIEKMGVKAIVEE